MAVPPTGWSEAIALHQTDQVGRCEAIAKQLAQAHPTGMRYECRTLFVPGSLK